MSQPGKLTRSARLAEHRGLVLDWLKSDPPPGLDDVARRLAALAPRAHASAGDALLAEGTAPHELAAVVMRSGSDESPIDPFAAICALPLDVLVRVLYLDAAMMFLAHTQWSRGEV